ncbi:hypothetical protein ACFLT9_09910 [Acidobacteriota bacterium]
MKNNFKFYHILVLALIICISTASALSSQQDFKPILGTWDVELTEMGMTFELVFKMEESEITGEMNFDMGSGELSEITLADGKLTFLSTFDAGGQTMSIEATATVEGDEMNGTMSSDMGDAEFTGTKRKE